MLLLFVPPILRPWLSPKLLSVVAAAVVTAPEPAVVAEGVVVEFWLAVEIELLVALRNSEGTLKPAGAGPSSAVVVDAAWKASLVDSEMDDEVREMVRSMTAAVVMRRRRCRCESSSDPDSDRSTSESSCTPRMDRVWCTHQY